MIRDIRNEIVSINSKRGKIENKRLTYAYNFKVGMGNLYSRNYKEGLVRTNSFGLGTISYEGVNIPINLAGKGSSKARKKARGILTWWVNSLESQYNRNNKKNKLLPCQKRPSQRARKQLKNKGTKTTPKSYTSSSRYSISKPEDTFFS